MPPDLAQSKQMIWDQIKAYHEAADKGDIDIVATILAPEVSIVINNDDVVRGHNEVVRVIRDQIKPNQDKPRSTITGKEVIKPDGDFAFVTYVASVGAQRGIITAICRRTKEGKWLIAHIHDTWSMPAPKK